MAADVKERSEHLFRAVGGVGGDLIDTAEKRTFGPGLLRKWMPIAACLAILLGLGLLVQPALWNGEPSAGPVVGNQPDAMENTAKEEALEEGTGTPAVPRERLVVLDTVYYVEAHYTDAEAEPWLGSSVGTVWQADRPELEGERVYAKKDCSFRWFGQTQVPMEIFVTEEKGYAYCLTYFVRTTPLFTLEEIQKEWKLGKQDAVAGLLQLELPCFEKASDLSAEELLQMFLVSLELERLTEHRTEDLNRYLWLEDNVYVIPAADVMRQLDRYLANYDFRVEQCRNYDASRQALILETLTPQNADGILVPTGEPEWDSQTGLLKLRIARCDADDPAAVVELLQYVIADTPEGWKFERVVKTAP